MTEQEFLRRVEGLCRRLEVKPARVKISPARGKDSLRIRLQGWTIRTTPRTLAELTEAEIDFGLALAIAARLEPGQKQPHIVAAPYAALSFIGIIILHFQQEVFIDHFWTGFGIMFGLMVTGYLAGMWISRRIDENARMRVIGEALNLTGNASAAQTYIIRCQTDHVVTGRRRLAAVDRDQLELQLEALAMAASSLWLNYSKVAFSD